MDRDGYFAGFLDADGGVSLYRRKDSKQSYELCVYAAKVDREVLDLLAQRFGGRVSGPYQNGESGRPIFHWRCYSRKALAVLEVLRPWLVNKRPQADLGIAFYETVVGYGKLPLEASRRREEIHSRMSALNRRGIN
jgi:hypothetical protein